MNKGGAFVRATKRAKLTLVERTANHPEGNKARLEDKPVKKKPAKPATATTQKGSKS